MADEVGNSLKSRYQNPLKIRFDLKFFKEIPKNPGVYFMQDTSKNILYIGKAKNLRNRILSYSYLKPGQALDHTLEMLESVHTIHWRECPSEAEALSTESELLHS